MPTRIRIAQWFLLMLIAAPVGTSQPLVAAPPASRPIEIHLGDSMVALNGPWKFRIGDSPVDPATGKLLWSEASFDDSRWETVDLTPPSGSFDPISGTSGYVPGWIAKGHPGYSGFAWYRTRIRVETHPGVKLALAGPPDLDDIYQALDDGVLIGTFGDFSGKTPAIYTARPEMFLMPEENPGASAHELAFRVWMDPTTLNQSDDVGGMHNPPLIGTASAIAAQNHVKWDELYRAYAPNLAEALVFTILGVLAFSLILFDRSDRVYLWIGSLLFVIALGDYLVVIGTWTEWLSYHITALREIVLFPLAWVGWVMVWRVWFRVRKPVWVPPALAALLMLLVLSNALGFNLFLVLPAHVAQTFHFVSLAVRLAIAALLIWTVVQGIFEQGFEGWVALPVVVLAGIAEFYQELGYFHILNIWFPFGLQLTTRQLADLLLVVALALLLLRRLVKSIRVQRQMAFDVKQAQEVQQVILPEARTMIPGLEIESEYRPALEVGGDFFQIIPHSADGSLLIVAGDVAGKGLKAGMLVALLVGAIRTVVQFKFDPLVLLEALNQRLIGRGDAFATCLAFRIDAEGCVTLANAGHLAPYLNGEPLALEGSLPLGMLEKPEFSVVQFNLRPGDKLTVLSDGVAEATDDDGHLFGFERVQVLLNTTSTAAQIAHAAQAYGQTDDISVISVTRTPVLQPSIA